ncbi:MAG TPA: hypothetical protein VHE30_22460, partial [Polyangiaceae bacterium]|nr:hypothetical protein [Polyangiaceae bacterium]
MMRFFHAFTAAAFLTTLASHALADLAPPGGYVESCTLEKQAAAGLECLSCRAFYGNHDHCSKSLASYGFSQKCRARGASSWSEVWCRAASPKAAKVPAAVVDMLPYPNGKPPPGEETPAASAASAASADP